LKIRDRTRSCYLKHNKSQQKFRFDTAKILKMDKSRYALWDLDGDHVAAFAESAELESMPIQVVQNTAGCSN
jgi:hypothetical protein